MVSERRTRTNVSERQNRHLGPKTATPDFTDFIDFITKEIGPRRLSEVIGFIFN